MVAVPVVPSSPLAVQVNVNRLEPISPAARSVTAAGAVESGSWVVALMTFDSAETLLLASLLLTAK